MTIERFLTSAPDEWSKPRPQIDPATRLYRHGPIQPMEESGLMARLGGMMIDMVWRN